MSVEGEGRVGGNIKAHFICQIDKEPRKRRLAASWYPAREKMHINVVFVRPRLLYIKPHVKVQREQESEQWLG